MPQQNLNINLKEAEEVVCEACTCEHFVPVFSMKKLSALVSPTGQEAMIPIQLFRCVECGHVNSEFTEHL